MADRLTVCLATHNRPALLKRTLESLAMCERPGIYQGLIVVNAGRPSKAAENIVGVFQERLNARYCQRDAPSKSAALNFAIEKVEGLVFFTDDDVRYSPAVLNAYANASRQDGEGVFYGGPQRVDCEHPPPQWLRAFLPASATGWDPQDLTEDRTWFMGNNWAAFAGDIKKYGGFNPRLGPGSPLNCAGDETEMQSRLRLGACRPRYVAQAEVWHFVPAERCSPGWALERAYQNGVTVGLLNDYSCQSKLWGYPRWMIRDWIQRSADIFKALFKGRPDLFKALYFYQISRGRRKAARFALDLR